MSNKVKADVRQVKPMPVEAAKIKSPKLELVQPQVDPATRRVSFLMRNQGDLAASSSYSVRYEINGVVEKTFPKLAGFPLPKKPKPLKVRGELHTQALSVEPGQQVELGNITLPESAWNNKQLKIRVNLKDRKRGSKFNASQSYDYTWPVRQLTVGAIHLGFLNTLMKGELRLHNYKDPGKDKTKHLPLAKNQSRVTIMNKTSNFSIDRARIKVVDKEHFFFIRDFTAPLGGDDFISIEDGKLGMRLVFECSDDRREIKGWTRDYINKRYVDSTTPDINIQRFSITVTLSPTLYNNKLSYRNVVVSVGSKVRFEGGWAWLNGLKGILNKEIKSKVTKILTKMLNDIKIKTELEKNLTKAVMDMNANIHHLVSVRGSGEEIIIEYI